jgi:predicted Zn-dependent protease
VIDHKGAAALDLSLLARWIEPLSRDGFADLFFEWKRELRVSWKDGEVHGPILLAENGVSARGRRGDRLVIAASPRADEAGAREVVRRLAGHLSSSAFPKSSEREPDEVADEFPDSGAWVRKLGSMFARAFGSQGHRVEVRRLRSARLIVGAPGGPHQFSRARISVHGRLLADTRGGPRWRVFDFHLPEADDGAFEELRQRLRGLSSPGGGTVPPAEGTSDILFENGSAAFFFHEVLSHPLEADAPVSRLANLLKARVCPREIEVGDEPSRLDLFGGYPVDDEGVPARRTHLINAGHLAALLRDRVRSDALHPSTGNGRRASPFDHGAPRGSNVVVGSGGASEGEMLHRLSTGIRVEELVGGSVDPASGEFRLKFAAAQTIQRGRPGQSLGPGILEGDILDALGQIDPLLGVRVKPCRQLAWCAQEGKVLPVGGEAPAMIVRKLHVRPQ